MPASTAGPRAAARSRAVRRVEEAAGSGRCSTGSFGRQRGGDLLRAVRMALIERDGPGCAYCAAPAGRHGLEIDLALPASKGGEARWDNIVAVCGSCRRAKGDRSALEFGLDRLASLLNPGR